MRGVADVKVWAGIDGRRLVQVIRAFARAAGAEEVVDFLRIQRAVVDADLVEHAFVVIRIERHVAEVHRISSARKEAALIRHDALDAVDVDATQAAHAIVGDGDVGLGVRGECVERDKFVCVAGEIRNLRVHFAAQLKDVHTYVRAIGSQAGMERDESGDAIHIC